MDITALRTFVDVMRRGSFAAAARDRNVAPSSISRAVANLEEHLGVRLFNRTTRQLSPTEAARAYYERIEPMIDELERATLEVSDSGGRPRGTLRITAPVNFAQRNVVPLLPEFSRRFPELGFDLVITDTFIDLVEERIDLALRVGRLDDSSLIAHRLCSMVYVVCASPEYLRRKGRPKTPADLAHHDCLRYPIRGFGASWRFREADGPIFEVPVRGRVVANNGVALRQCAVGGMGILMLPHWNIAEELERGELVALFPQYQATASDFEGAAWMLYPSRTYLPLKVRVFADFLKEKFDHGAPSEARSLAREKTRRGAKNERMRR